MSKETTYQALQQLIRVLLRSVVQLPTSAYCCVLGQDTWMWVFAVGPKNKWHVSLVTPGYAAQRYRKNPKGVYFAGRLPMSRSRGRHRTNMSGTRQENFKINPLAFSKVHSVEKQRRVATEELPADHLLTDTAYPWSLTLEEDNYGCIWSRWISEKSRERGWRISRLAGFLE